MHYYTLKQIEVDTGLKYDYLRKCLRQVGEAFQDHASKPSGQGWRFDQQGLELFKQIASFKQAGLDLPQIKKELARLGYLEVSEASAASGAGDSADSGAAHNLSDKPVPKTGEAFVMELLVKVDQANEKIEDLREKQFAKDRRMLKYQSAVKSSWRRWNTLDSGVCYSSERGLWPSSASLRKRKKNGYALFIYMTRMVWIGLWPILGIGRKIRGV